MAVETPKEIATRVMLVAIENAVLSLEESIRRLDGLAIDSKLSDESKAYFAAGAAAHHEALALLRAGAQAFIFP